MIRIIDKLKKIPCYLLVRINRINKYLYIKRYNPRLKSYNLKNKNTVFIFRHLNIVYNGVKKSGSSNIVRLLSTLDTFKKEGSQELSELSQDIGTNSLRDKHRFLNQFLPNINKNMVFIFVRNPYIRVVSLFKDKIVLNKIKIPINPLGNMDDSLESFENFIDYLAEGNLYYNAHFYPQSQSSFFHINTYDFIGTLENFEEDFLKMLKLSGQEIPDLFKELIKRKNNSSHQTHSANRYLSYYNDRIQEKVYRLYEEDFITFSYSKDIHIKERIIK